MKFLNGWKTILGAIGTVVVPLVAVGGKVGELAGKVAEVGQHVDIALTGVFGALLALGIVHKVEKSNTPPASLNQARK